MEVFFQSEFVNFVLEHFLLLCGLLLYLIDDNIVSFLLLLHLCNFDVAFLDLTKVRMLLSEHDSILHLECLHFFVVNFLFLLELDILILELLNLVSHGFIGIRFINALILLENIWNRFLELIFDIWHLLFHIQVGLFRLLSRIIIFFVKYSRFVITLSEILSNFEDLFGLSASLVGSCGESFKIIVFIAGMVSFEWQLFNLLGVICIIFEDCIGDGENSVTLITLLDGDILSHIRVKYRMKIFNLYL